MRNKVAKMKPVKLENAFLMIEKGPVVLISTSYRGKNNIMPLSWITVIDFTPRFALCTGSWNYSYEALVKTKECVIAIPGVDLIDKVIEAGNVSGSDTDKFALCGFETAPSKYISAPLIKDCLGNIECKVVDHIKKHNLFILEGVYAWACARKESRAFHAVGDGTFIADGRKLNRRKLMLKIPEWLK